MFSILQIMNLSRERLGAFVLGCKAIERRFEALAGKMAQHLRALVAFPEYLGSVFSAYMAAHNHLLLQFQEIQQLT